MDSGGDFMRALGEDLSLKILTYLDDPADLVRLTNVSSVWRHFVIGDGLCKKLCLRMFPELSCVVRVVEPNIFSNDPVSSKSLDSSEWPYPHREHRAYVALSRELTRFSEDKCLWDALCASSTDNYPRESIKNTIFEDDRIDSRPSYWSSKGNSNPATPEILIYQLKSPLCVVSEVQIHPFQAYFQSGSPIYSARGVRFHLGYPRNFVWLGDDFSYEFVDDHPNDSYVWTYTSPVFQMAQENCLQTFKLPRPVLCMGRVLAVELIGRVQTQEMDGLYYFCVNHVQVIGSPIPPLFDVEMTDQEGKFALVYQPGKVPPCFGWRKGSRSSFDETVRHTLQNLAAYDSASDNE